MFLIQHFHELESSFYEYSINFVQCNFRLLTENPVQRLGATGAAEVIPLLNSCANFSWNAVNPQN